jgi:hypothetical protein
LQVLLKAATIHAKLALAPRIINAQAAIKPAHYSTELLPRVLVYAITERINTIIFPSSVKTGTVL